MSVRDEWARCVREAGDPAGVTGRAMVAIAAGAAAGIAVLLVVVWVLCGVQL